MSDESKFVLPKLSADGSNWVTYRDRLLWAFTQRHWSDHLTSTGTPAAYTTAGPINGVDPDTRWANEEGTTMTLIAASVPDHVFNRIKTKTNTMEVWNAIKAIYQTRSKMITVDLGKQLSSTRLDDVRSKRPEKGPTQYRMP
jgi:hypothetical protein